MAGGHRPPLQPACTPSPSLPRAPIPHAAWPVPKIIHQTYKTTEVPEKWREATDSVRSLHPDYEYMFWTDDSAREFIAQHYSWFLPTWDSYPYNIQRSDALRYIVLYHFGGVYIDMDVGCNYRCQGRHACVGLHCAVHSVLPAAGQVGMLA